MNIVDGVARCLVTVVGFFRGPRVDVSQGWDFGIGTPRFLDERQ